MAEYLTAEELADRYRTSVEAVYIKRHKGQLPPAYKLGRLLWRVDEVEAWERSQREDEREAV